MPKIKGGYYIKARCIQESEIQHAPPHFREIWDWLLKEANHQDKKYGKYAVKRGQCFRTYKDIRDGLSWNVGYRKERYSENQTKKAMKFLRDALMIVTTKELGGVLITICNYELYQNPKNYERTEERTNEGTNGEPMGNQGGADNNKNVKNLKNVKKTFLPDSDEIRLVDYFIEKIKLNKPDFKEPNKQSWAKDFDFILRIDKKSPKKVAELIKWCQKDSFEMINVQCPDKLRSRWDPLEMKMNKGEVKKGADWG